MGRVAFVLCAFMSTQIAFSQAWRGVDVSFLPEMEGDGVVYQDFAGAAIEDHVDGGVNLVTWGVAQSQPQSPGWRSWKKR